MDRADIYTKRGKEYDGKKRLNVRRVKEERVSLYQRGGDRGRERGLGREIFDILKFRKSIYNRRTRGCVRVCMR